MIARAKNKSKISNTSQIYSYIRFSTAEQSLGDSERRQLEAAEKYAKDIGLPLNETLVDRGISGFRGKHKKANAALGRFLIRVENGEVSEGSVLLVENIDRLGREPILDAFETITKLIKSGIKIQTLTPYQLYDTESINSYLIYQLVGQIQRAYEESLRKSELISQARKNARKLARENGKILTKRCPAWLTVEDDEFEVIPEAAETVRLIFELKLNGLGKTAIVKRLNSEVVWMPPKGNGWRESYIQKIIRNRAVIGEYQPYKMMKRKRIEAGAPIPEYYPRVVDEDNFYAVQELIKKNGGKGGKTGKAYNLFACLVKCPYCGGSMAFENKGKGQKSFVCDNARRGVKCESYRIRYNEVEELILKNCRSLKPDQVLPNPDERSRLCQSLRKRIQGHIAKLRDIERQIDNLMVNLSNTKNPKMVERYERDIEKLDKQKTKTESQKAIDEKELNTAESSVQSFTKWQKGLGVLQKTIKKDNGVELRMRLRLHLREFIEKIEVFTVGFKKHDEQITFEILTDLWDKNVKNSMDKKTWAIRKKEYTDFCSYLNKRIHVSKEARFIHIYFKSGWTKDIWPTGSIPYNLIFWIDNKGNIDWQRTGSSFKPLWDDYNDSRKVKRTG